MTDVRTTTIDRVLDAILSTAVPLSGLGLAGLAASLALGFEEANQTMLAISSGLLLAAPLAVVLHVALTRGMTPKERRSWLHALAGPSALSAFSRYVATHQRRRSTSSSARRDSVR